MAKELWEHLQSNELLKRYAEELEVGESFVLHGQTFETLKQLFGVKNATVDILKGFLAITHKKKKMRKTLESLTFSLKISLSLDELIILQ